MNGTSDDCIDTKQDVNNTDLSDTPDDSGSGVNLPTYEPEWYKPLTLWDISKSAGSSRGRSSTSSRVSNSSRTSHSSGVSGSGPQTTPVKSDAASAHQWYEMTETSRCSEGDESVADFSV